jgi:hypothetical protein
LKLLDIKQQLVEAYFKQGAAGIPEEQVLGKLKELCELLSADYEGLAASAPLLTEDTVASYRGLAAGSQSYGYMSDGSQALYIVARKGKKLGCINLTAPTQEPRFTTWTSIKEAYNSSADLDGSIAFNTCYIK